MRADQRPRAANAADQHQVLLGGMDNIDEDLSQLLGLERAAECFFQCGIAIFTLLLKRTI